MCPKSPVLGHLCDWSCVATRRVCSLLLLTALQLVRQVFFSRPKLQINSTLFYLTPFSKSQFGGKMLCCTQGDRERNQESVPLGRRIYALSEKKPIFFFFKWNKSVRERLKCVWVTGRQIREGGFTVTPWTAQFNVSFAPQFGWMQKEQH